MTPSIMLVPLIFIGISMLVSSVLKSRFAAYGKIPLSARLTGKQVAEKMLREKGIYGVNVVSVEGFLTDHYNPANKTVNFSPEVYHGYSISAAAVCGTRNRPRCATCHRLCVAELVKQACTGCTIQRHRC